MGVFGAGTLGYIDRDDPPARWLAPPGEGNPPPPLPPDEYKLAIGLPPEPEVEVVTGDARTGDDFGETS